MISQPNPGSQIINPPVYVDSFDPTLRGWFIEVYQYRSGKIRLWNKDTILFTYDSVPNMQLKVTWESIPSNRDVYQWYDLKEFLPTPHLDY